MNKGDYMESHFGKGKQLSPWTLPKRKRNAVWPRIWRKIINQSCFGELYRCIWVNNYFVEVTNKFVIFRFPRDEHIVPPDWESGCYALNGRRNYDVDAPDTKRFFPWPEEKVYAHIQKAYATIKLNRDYIEAGSREATSVQMKNIICGMEELYLIFYVAHHLDADYLGYATTTISNNGKKDDEALLFSYYRKDTCIARACVKLQPDSVCQHLIYI